MRRIGIVAGIVLLGPLFLGSGAHAEDRSLCKADAKNVFRGCKRDCKETFRADKDSCRKIDHVCADACRADRAVCVAPVRAALDAAIAACDATLADARARCRGQFADGTDQRDRCIDRAQVEAFECRDEAREAARPGLKTCKRAFRRCIREQCPPDAPVDRDAFLACRADAKDLQKRCKGSCREAFQLAKDTCLDRDHACVEACRADRSACRAPFLEALETAVAVCQADRDAAIAVCKQLHERSSEARDRCIDAAQTDAFRCRDDARELVKPDLSACRDAFRDCARACPPPPSSPSGAFVR